MSIKALSESWAAWRISSVYVIDIADGLDEQSVRMQLAKIVERCGGVLESNSIRAETDFYLTVARVLTWFKNWDCIFFIVWRRLRSFTILNGLSNLYRSSKNTILVFCGSLDVRGFHRFAKVTQGMPIP